MGSYMPSTALNLYTAFFKLMLKATLREKEFSYFYFADGVKGLMKSLV